MRKEKKKQVSGVATANSLQLRANSSVLSRLLNVSSDGDDVTVAGKLFQTRAAATGCHIGCHFPANRKLMKLVTTVPYAWPEF